MIRSEAQRRASTRRVRPGSSLVALALIAGLAACGEPQLADVKPRDRKVLLIGIDGLDFRLVNELFKNGQLAKFSELRAHGIEVPLIGEQATRDPFSVGVDPAETWTTIATGFPPTKTGEEIKTGHGIRDITVPIADSYERAPTTTTHRRLPVFWDVLSAVGVKSAIVNWPVTWPAEPLDGYVVSDRFFHAKFGLTWLGSAGRVDLPEVSPEQKSASEHLTWPPELAEPHAGAVAAAMNSAPPPLFGALKQLQSRTTHAPTLRNLKQYEQAVRTDYATKQSLVQLLKSDPSIRFAACYLDSFDVACHLFWGHIEPDQFARSADPAVRSKLPQNFNDYRSVIPMASIAIDAMVRDLCDAMGPDTTVVLVSDHSLQVDPEPANRDFSLNRLFERLGWLARNGDGSIDWAHTRCFDLTQWETNFIRHVSINFAGQWPQGSVPAPTAQERGVRWSEIQNQLLRLKTNQPVIVGDNTMRPTLFWDMNMGDTDSHFIIYQMLRGETEVELPDGTKATVNQLFPPRYTYAKHTSISGPGTLLLSYPGAQGEAYGKRGIPMGKGGGRCLHVAPLILGLFGIPLSADPYETTASGDFLQWMLDVREAQEMAITPRVRSFEELVRFSDPASRLGMRRAELRRYVEGLKYTFDQPATQTEPGAELQDGAAAPEESGVRDDVDGGR